MTVSAKQAKAERERLEKLRAKKAKRNALLGGGMKTKKEGRR